MKSLATQGPCDRSIGADDPQIEAQRLGNRKRKSVPPTRYQDDLNSRFTRALERRQIRLGDLELGVEQGAVNVNGEQSDGQIHRV